MGDTVKYIFNNPGTFIKMVGNTIKYQSKVYIRTFIGIFGWLDTHPPIEFLRLIFVVLIFLVINGEQKAKVTLWDRFIFLGVGFGLFLVLTTVSLQWYGPESRGQVYFTGIQGRYFYPFVIPPLLSLYQSKIRVNLEKYSYIITSFSVFALIFSLNVILCRYWLA